jgi:hypothetical protein
MTKPENTLADVAGRIAVHANAENKKFGIDPLTILTIISIIIRIIAMIYECRKNRDYAKRTIKQPGIFARFLMKRAIRKHFPKDERQAIYNAMLAVGPQLSEKELDDTLDIVETELNSK